MTEREIDEVRGICRASGAVRKRLLDVARAVQARFGGVPPEAITAIAEETGTPRVEVDGLVSFYSFLSRERRGEIVIRLSDDPIDRLAGYDGVRAAFEEELGVGLGETTPDGRFTLERTACTGMCDQAPAGLVNDTPVTCLTPERAREIVRELRSHGDPARLVGRLGDGANADQLVLSMVRNHIREEGPLVLSPLRPGEAIRKATAISPQEVIRTIKAARLRGRGGAGFPTGMKWEFTRAAPGERKFVVCNADEGEPGTFKDRVLLTERPDRVFAGMTIAGYAIGAEDGILYLRAEYAYLRRYLEHVLERRRREGLLGANILGKRGFHFDVRIQMGAGAYVCGEETALLSSCEGSRGDPKNRPPFPAQRGYLGFPTAVNNVETLCFATKIMHEGAATFCEHGAEQSSGTKLLSVSGDVRRPGVFEVPFGVTLGSVLDRAGAADPGAVLVGGPSGRMVGPDDFGRKICYEDLATGGAVAVFGRDRDLLEIVHGYMEFFVDESCGYCTPCRVGNVLLLQGVERIIRGRGEPADLEEFRRLGKTLRLTSRCGLGQTSANPVLTTMESHPDLFEDRVSPDPHGFRRSFDLDEAVAEASRLRGGEE